MKLVTMPLSTSPFRVHLTFLRSNNISEIAKKVAALCEVLKKIGIKQVAAVKYAEQLRQKITGDEILGLFIFNESQLSNAKKAEKGSKEEELAKRILVTLLIMLDKSGYIFNEDKINIISTNGKQIEVEIFYTKHTINLIPYEENPLDDHPSLSEYGLRRIISEEPSKEIHELIKDVYELRILQSCLYGWENDWEKIVKEGFENGKLTKIKFLLAQPFSLTAQARGHTISPNVEEALMYFNDQAKAIFSKLINFENLFKNKTNPTTKKTYEIQIRLYFDPSAIPIYQCLNENSDNLATYFGVFWNDESSRKGPHFEVINNSKLISFVNRHFNSIWDNLIEEDPSKLDWQQILGPKKTIPMPMEGIQYLYKTFEKAYQLRAFSNFQKTKPNWIHFLCRYHNKENESREFILDLDIPKQIARIRNTHRQNRYYGIVIPNTNNYSVILHNCRHRYPDQIIYINFFARDGNLETVNHPLFGIYNNSGTADHIPYAQVMILLRAINKTRGKDEVEVVIPDEKFPELEDFRETIKEKKIDIEFEERSNTNDKILGNYVLQFDKKNRKRFYQYLKKETNRANDHVFIVGQGPSYFPGSDTKEKETYLESHITILKEKKVRITRILLDNKIDPGFKSYLKKIKGNAEIGDRYKIFTLKNNIPVFFDLILIDPGERHRTAVLVYSKNEEVRNARIVLPIKLVVLHGSNDEKIINSFYHTCERYLNMPEDQLMELRTDEDINIHLSDNS